MKHKRMAICALAAVLALLLLVGCGLPGTAPAEPELSAEPEVSAAPETTEAPEESAAPVSGRLVKVTNVDELLAAIAPDTTIELAAGDYPLYTAKNYGGVSESVYYEWARRYDGPTLEIRHADNLVIRGAGADQVKLTAEPRFAEVLSFISCRGVTVEGITLGHTQAPGYCSGGVLRFDGCRGCAVRACGLYGCGTVGVSADDCAELRIEDTAIYECSTGALSLSSCREVRVRGGEVYGCGRRESLGGAMNLFELSSCDTVIVAGVRVHDNTAERLLSSWYSRSVLFLSDEVRGNAFTSFFGIDPFGAIVDGCRFEGNSSLSWYADSAGTLAVDLTGRELDGPALSAMTLREIDPDMILPPAEAPAEQSAEPGAEIRVKTVDEFLAAIGPDRTIVLDGTLFDLSTASAYGGRGGLYYHWEEVYDGYELVIDAVRGLTIKAASEDPMQTTLAAVPRYANVLAFKGCEDIAVEGFTAGHTAEPGSCSGGVLFFENCRRLSVEACRLYGCGILGLQASGCRDVEAIHTEIYDCTDGAVNMYNTDGISFLSCSIHDVPDPALVFYACSGVSWDGEALTGEHYRMQGVNPVLMQGVD